MLESSVKGIVYQVSSFNLKDKETGKDLGSLINIKYVCRTREDKADWKGFTAGETNVQFSEEIYNKLCSDFLLKSTNLGFKLVQDYKDPTKYNSKLYSINDFVIRQ